MSVSREFAYELLCQFSGTYISGRRRNLPRDNDQQLGNAVKGMLQAAHCLFKQSTVSSTNAAFSRRNARQPDSEDIRRLKSLDAVRNNLATICADGLVDPAGDTATAHAARIVHSTVRSAAETAGLNPSLREVFPIRKADIIDLFHELARCASERELHVEAKLGGGCSLMLQTHIRHTADDYDMAFTKVTNKNRQDLSLGERWELFAEFVAQSRQGNLIDSDNPHFLDPEVYRTSIALNSMPYLSIKDSHGFGATINLALLESLYSLHKMGLMIRDQAEVMEMFGVELPRKPDPAEDIKRDRDGWALGIILNDKWPGDGPADADILKRQALLGRRPITFQTIQIGD